MHKLSTDKPLFGLILLALLATAPPLQAAGFNEILLRNSLVFPGPAQSQIKVPTGIYRVEVASHSTLHLESLSGHFSATIAAQESTHREEVLESVALAKAISVDSLLLLVLQQDGKMYAAVGSHPESKSINLPPLLNDSEIGSLYKARLPAAKHLQPKPFAPFPATSTSGFRRLKLAAPGPENSIELVQVIIDIPSVQVIHVSYRFEVFDRCQDREGFLVVAPGEDALSKLFPSYSTRIVAHDPILPPDMRLPPLHGRIDQSNSSVLGQPTLNDLAIEEWRAKLPTADLILQYLGLESFYGIPWKIEIRCGQPKVPGDDLLISIPYGGRPWWSFGDVVSEDGDGISDSGEQFLAQKYAPEVHLPPDDKDWTRPANVDWYLARTALRFKHRCFFCDDCTVLQQGDITQQNLYIKHHKMRLCTSFCTHTSDVRYATRDHYFFLKSEDDSTHSGSADPADWKVYFRVSRGPQHVGTMTGPDGYWIEYWFFYPYNQAVYPFNHEGDWEHITVTTDLKGDMRNVYFAQHDGGTELANDEFGLVPDTHHPIVYSAVGTHASYPAADTYTVVPRIFDDHTYDGGPIWRTWENLVNMGEKNSPLNGQDFILYGGLWGNIGEDIPEIFNDAQFKVLGNANGPPGPMFQD